MEQAIDEGYLQRLSDAYSEFFLADDTTPLLVVGTENFNPGERDADFALLLQQLAAFRGRRMFLNADVDLPLA
jgi:deoxyadenosine/deoxycytidine kinase